jgi:hypothetical protein
MSRSHAVYNFDIECNNFNKLDNNLWWSYTTETCNEEERWLDNKLHLRRKYMCKKSAFEVYAWENISQFRLLQQIMP